MSRDRRSYMKQYRKDNQDRDRISARARHRRSYIQRRLRVNGLKNHPCMDCGGSFPPECMDFDHVRGRKLFSVGMSLDHHPWPKLLVEIKKCDLVCANCHRIRTTRRARAKQS
jgi:hypothetical protein